MVSTIPILLLIRILLVSARLNVQKINLPEMQITFVSIIVDLTFGVIMKPINAWLLHLIARKVNMLTTRPICV